MISVSNIAAAGVHSIKREQPTEGRGDKRWLVSYTIPAGLAVAATNSGRRKGDTPVPDTKKIKEIDEFHFGS